MARTLGSRPAPAQVADGQTFDTSGHTGRVDLDALRSPASTLLLARLRAEHGLPVEQALAGAVLAEQALLRPGTEVTGRQELEVLRRLARAVPGAATALAAGRRYHLTTYGIWGFALASSPTARAALELGSRFVDLSFTFCRLEVQEDAEELRLLLRDDEVPADVRPFVVLRDLAGLHTIVTELLGGPVPLRRVVLREVPADAPLEVAFGVRPVVGPRAEVALDVHLLEQPLPQADELTRSETERQCRDLLERRHARTGTAGRVRDLLLRTPADLPPVAAAAASLHLSERTLRRRLAAEGTSYRALVDEVRQALAEELLATGGLSVEQVAVRLGYAETASFTHAFTRWRGVPPSRARSAARP